ncbi:MAG TPA: hypothetical protein VIV14_05790 [Gammaproteobacteria bacterium]
MNNEYLDAREEFTIRWADEPLNRLLLTLCAAVLMAALTIASALLSI